MHVIPDLSNAIRPQTIHAGSSATRMRSRLTYHLLQLASNWTVPYPGHIYYVSVVISFYSKPCWRGLHFFCTGRGCRAQAYTVKCI